MTDLLFVDTNLLIYSLDPANPAKQAKAVELLQLGMAAGVLVTSPQSLNECYRVLTVRRQLIVMEAARAFVSSLFPTCRAELDIHTVVYAWELEAITRFSWWDCLLLSAAIRAGCTYFLTEDLSDGQTVGGMRLLNPFQHGVRALLT